MEKSYQAKTVMTYLLCDDCKIEMIKQDVVVMSVPAEYIYQCPKCGKIEKTYTFYPRIHYVKTPIVVNLEENSSKI